MKRAGRWTMHCLAIATIVFLTSCRPAGTGGSGPTAPVAIKRHRLDGLKFKIGKYDLPRDQRRLDIAAPEDIATREVWEEPTDPKDLNEHLIAFHRPGSSLQKLPRILVAAEDSPFEDFPTVSETNVTAFVKKVEEDLGDEKLEELEEPVTPVIVSDSKTGDTAMAAWVESVQPGKDPVVRLVLKIPQQTGRLYTIKLEVRKSQFDRYRDAAYVVAASVNKREQVESQKEKKALKRSATGIKQ